MLITTVFASIFKEDVIADDSFLTILLHPSLLVERSYYLIIIGLLGSPASNSITFYPGILSYSNGIIP